MAIKTLLQMGVLYIFQICVCYSTFQCSIFFPQNHMTKYVVMMLGLSSSAKFVAHTYDKCTVALLTN